MWNEMNKILPEIKFGNWEIKYQLDPFNNTRINTCLYKNEFGVMDDSETEFNLTKDFIDNAYGNILILGLGLGVVPLYLQNKNNIFKIDIIEIDLELINKIKEYLLLNNKINIINEDVYKFNTKEKYDCIWCDITQKYTDKTNFELTKIYKKFLNKNGLIDYWGEK